MLYWLSNTGTTASIDYTNKALDEACYIVEQHWNNNIYRLFQRSNGRNMLYLWSNTVTTASIDYTNGALDEACYIGGATLEQQHVLIIQTEHVILAEQHWNNSIY